MKPTQIFRKVEGKSNDFLYSVGVKKVNAFVEGNRVLVYHGVTKKARTDINSRFISTETFEAQLRFYKRHFNVVPLGDIIRIQRVVVSTTGGPVPPGDWSASASRRSRISSSSP